MLKIATRASATQADRSSRSVRKGRDGQSEPTGGAIHSPAGSPGGGASPAEGAASDAVAAAVNEPAGTLPYGSAIQRSFGLHSVANVRAHVGPTAEAAAEAMGARAFAFGTHVVFRRPPDLHTAAHEAAHVIQQRAGIHLAGETSQAGDPFERHADAVAAQVVAGKSAEMLLDRMPAAAGIPARPVVQRIIELRETRDNKKKAQQPPANRLTEVPKVELAVKSVGVSLTGPVKAMIGNMVQSPKVYQFYDINDLGDYLKGQEALNEAEHQAHGLHGEERDRTVYGALIAKTEEHKAAKGTPKAKGPAVAAAYQAARMHGIKFIADAGRVRAWGGANLIPQTPQQRGDMTHVLPALKLDPTARLVVCFEYAAGTMIREGAQLLEHYRPVKDQVCVYPGSVAEVGKTSRQGGADTLRPLTRSTEIMVESARKDPLSARKRIQSATIGEIGENDLAAYEKWAQLLGFQKGLSHRYVIVSHRDSGHNVPPGRQASHPELDTGKQEGFAQLLEAVKQRGMTPVPMGEPTLGREYKPNMVKWWLVRPSGFSPSRTKRQVEYGMGWYLSKYYGVRQLAMRSGNTDAMAFAGMETVFLDLATETAPLGQRNRANLRNAAHNRSWRRAAQLESILPGVFHQAFFHRPRKDGADPDPNWEGGFHARDKVRISKAVQSNFGSTTAVINDRDRSSPLHPSNTTAMAAKVADEHVSPEDRFANFAKSVETMRNAQIRSPAGRLNTVSLGLERVETQMSLIAAEMEAKERSKTLIGRALKQVGGRLKEYGYDFDLIAGAVGSAASSSSSSSVGSGSSGGAAIPRATIMANDTPGPRPSSAQVAEVGALLARLRAKYAEFSEQEL